MIRPLLIVGALTFGLPLAFADDAAPADVAQPNIVVLFADDLGWGEINGAATEQIPTPHLDRLKASGLNCLSAYVTAPNCSPSRAGLLTGQFPTRFGYEFNPIGAKNEEPNAGLPPETKTIAETLHDVGYTTGMVGKWHLGGTAKFHPRRNGFDEFFGFMHEGHFFVPPPYRGVTTMLRRKALPAGAKGRFGATPLIYTEHMGHDEPIYDANNPIVRDSQPVDEREYLTDAFTREAVDFISRHRDRPFFLYLAYNAVHSPLQGKEEHMRQHAGIDDVHRRIFASMLTSLDESVCTVVNTLDELHLRERTLIVFLSDNGGPTRELTSSNLPLRGEKSSMYEGGIRVPMVLSWPGVIPAGGTTSEVVSSLDLYPTFARLAGANVPKGIDGTDLLPLMSGTRKPWPSRTLYWRQGRRTALRRGDWKVVSPRLDKSGRLWELYHVADDATESNNLADEEPQKLRELQSEWERLDEQMAEPLFR